MMKKIKFVTPTKVKKSSMRKKIEPPMELHDFSASSIRTTNKRVKNDPFHFQTSERSYCAGRTGLLIFCVIIGFIIFTVITLSIVFGVIFSRRTGSGSGSSSGQNSGSSNTPATSVVASTVVIGTQTGSPCSSYTSINDPTRSINQLGSYGTCDNTEIFNASGTGFAWIRFLGTGGTMLATSAPGANRCGAFLPAWFNGSLPSIVGSPSNETICVETPADPCGIKDSILVTLCPGSFYVYLLPALPVCKTRYCTN